MEDIFQGEHTPQPHEKYFDVLYDKIPNILTRLFPNEVVNHGLISNGTRNVALISFKLHSGKPLPDHHWHTLKQAIRDDFNQTEVSDILELDFSDQDKDYDDNQTVILTKI